MKKWLSAFIVVFFVNAGNAQLQQQGSYISDLAGRAVLSKAPGFMIEGSYFYSNDYKKASLIFANKKFAQDLPVKLNLMDNEVIFQDENGNELVVTTPLREIRFLDKNTIFRSGYPAVKNLTANAYYEVLDSGKATLLKNYSVTYWDAKGYNSPSPTRTFEQHSTYVIYTGGQMYLLEKGNINVWLDMAGADKERLAGFIKDKGLKFKKEDDYIALVKFYNRG